MTANNKLLITNVLSSDPKLYVYRDCKDYETEVALSSSPRCVVVIPGTDIAVVTLANEQAIQVINTRTIEKGDKVNVRLTCFGIAAGRDRIYVGGEGGIIRLVYNMDVSGTAGITLDR